MMHDARRITDARTSSIESDRELQFPVWRDSVASTKRHFLSLYRFAFWVGSHRRAVRSASSLFLPLFNERERHRFDRKRSRRDGVTDGRKGAIIRNNLPESIPITVVLSFPSAVDHADVNQLWTGGIFPPKIYRLASSAFITVGCRLFCDSSNRGLGRAQSSLCRGISSVPSP